MSSIDYKVQPAEEHHAEGLADLFYHCYKGKYPLKEFTEPELSRKAIRENKYVWMVAIHEGDVIGSACGIRAEWNKSFEHGRAAVHKDFRKHGVIQKMVDTVVSECFKHYDIGWFAMRDFVGVSFSEKNNHGLIGFTPGQHVVKFREDQLLYGVVQDRFRNMRVASSSVLGEYKDIVSHAESELNLLPVYGEYPSEVFVGDTSGLMMPSGDANIYYHYESLDDAILVGSVYPDNISSISYLFNVIGSLGAGYVHIDVLADKFSSHDVLLSRGFEMCGFLPGWFLKDKNRYDCIRFALSDDAKSLDGEVSSRVSSLRKIFR